MINIIIKEQHNTDIEIVICGYEKCSKGHSFGPAVRDYYLIHYVVSGRGIFECGGITHELERGNGFLICPKQLTYYRADNNEPWEYIWVGFKGVKAKELLQRIDLAENAPVFHSTESLKFFEGMIKSQGMQDPEMIILSNLYGFFAYLAQGSNRQSHVSITQSYVRQAIQYINSNYINNISISGIASLIGLNRSYLYEIFKEYTGMSPQQYLISYRMEKACRLLDETDLKISDVARSVGYEDEFMFTRMFKNKKGISPSEYKIRCRGK
jgi:AraC-like DNA-binding protein